MSDQRLQFLRDERDKACSALPISHQDHAQEAFDHYLVGYLAALICDADWERAVKSACELITQDSKRRLQLRANSQELKAGSQ